MKTVMIFVSCVLAAASAGYTAHGAHLYSAPVVGPSSYAYQNSGAYPAASHAVAYNAPVAHGYAHGGYYGAEARLVDPVAIAAGAPLPVEDTYEVAAAKAAHFKAHAIARSNANGVSHAASVEHEYAYAQAAPVSHGYAHGGYYGTEARLVDPVAIAAGAPLPVGDTNEVAAAKAAHFKAHAIATGHAQAAPLAHGYSHVAPVAHGYEYVNAAPVVHGYAHGGHYASEARLVDPVAIAAGAPLPVGDTYEVAAAKAAHFKAHAAARGNAHGYSHSASVAHGYGYVHAAPVVHGYAHAGYYGAKTHLVDPVAIAAGAPLSVEDTYEVAAAKAAHFKAHAIARGHAHAAPIAHGYSHVAPVAHGYGYAHAAPVAHGYAHGGHYASEARLIDPVAISAGAPLPGGDTYEVAAAKAAHLKAHAAVKSGYHGSYYD